MVELFADSSGIELASGYQSWFTENIVSGSLTIIYPNVWRRNLSWCLLFVSNFLYKYLFVILKHSLQRNIFFFKGIYYSLPDLGLHCDSYQEVPSTTSSTRFLNFNSVISYVNLHNQVSRIMPHLYFDHTILPHLLFPDRIKGGGVAPCCSVFCLHTQSC